MSEINQQLSDAARELAERGSGYIVADREGCIYRTFRVEPDEFELLALDNIDDLGDWQQWDGETYDEFDAMPADAQNRVVDYIVELCQERVGLVPTFAALKIECGGYHEIGANHHPACPICGMVGHMADDDSEPTYPCGHFTGMICDLWDGDMQELLADELSVAPTHMISFDYRMGAAWMYFFRAANELDAVMTIKEASELYNNITVEGVMKAIQRHQLWGRKSGGTWLIRRADADARWRK